MKSTTIIYNIFFIFKSNITLITSKSYNIIKKKYKYTLNTITKFPYQKNIQSHTYNYIHIFQYKYKKHLLHKNKPNINNIILSIFN